MKKIFLLLLTAALIAVVSFAQQEEPLQVYQQFKDAGIDPSFISGCTDICNFQDGVLRLSSGAVLTSIPAEVTSIDTSDGPVTLPDGSEISDGIYNLDTGTFTGGSLTLSTSSKLSLDFEQSLIETSKGTIIDGNGRIEDGKLVFIEEARFNFDGEEEYRIKGAEVKNFDEDKKIIAGSTDKGFSIRTGEGAISLSEGKDFKIENRVISCVGLDQICTIEAEGDLSFSVKGIGTDRGTTTLLLNGKEHKLEGVINFDNGDAYFNKNPNKKVQGIDGIYLQSNKKSIGVHFDDEDYGGDYISLGRRFHARGDGFKIAFGMKDAGYISQEFPFNHINTNNYILQEQENSIPGRLEVIMHGGSISFDKESQKFDIEAGGADIINGVGRIIYSEDSSGDIDYSFKPVSCTNVERETLGIGTESRFVPQSCGMVNVGIQDGGFVDYTTDIGLEDIRKVKPEVKMFKFTLKKTGETKEYELDTSKVYIAGYKGGEFAKALASDEKKAKAIWGHVAVMYYQDDRWWVSEADGTTVKVRPFEDSLFSTEGKLEGIRSTPSGDRSAIIKEAERDAGSPYDAPKGIFSAVSFLASSRPTKHCAQLVACALSVSPEDKKRLSMVTIDKTSKIDTGDAFELMRRIARSIGEAEKGYVPQDFMDNPRFPAVPELSSEELPVVSSSANPGSEGSAT